MNKNKAILAGAAMVALSMPLAQQEAQAATSTINASAIVVAAIALTGVSAVHFGTMSIPGAGTITVSVGGVTNGGDGTGISALGSSTAEQNGTFSFTAGDATVDFTTNLPVTLTAGLDLDQVFLTGAGVTLTFGTGAANTQSGAVTGAAGGTTLNVGGRLTSTGAIAAGTYSGALVLTAAYQ